MTVAQPADWGLRFQALATDAGQLAARLLRRYQDLLDRVTRGELNPADVQQQFREHVQQQTAASTRDLVELSVGLLAGLVYVEARYREALLDGLLPAGTPVPPPPRPNGYDVTTWFQALATYATEQSARGMARQQALIERVAAGDISPAQFQDHGRRVLERHAPEFLGEMVDLGLAFVGGLQRSSASFSDGLYDRVLGPDRAAGATPEPPVCVDLRGPSGSLASAAIVVENTRPDTADVVCRVSEFTARAFGRRFRAAVTIDPEHFRLGAGEQQDVTLQLPLDEAVFAPGADYVATLQISGAGDRELIVQLLARADASAAEAEPRDSNAAVQPPGEADTREAADAPRRTSRAGSTRRSTASRQRKRR